jgi:hypothetical protein
MADELSINLKESRTASEAGIADARCLPLANSSVDFVLTSPPYCTRIDYVVNTSFELAALGLSRATRQFADLRRGCMGTPLARGGPPQECPNHWPQRLRDLLNRIKQHPSKASNSYYFKTFWQYFEDCERSLKELRRCLRPNSVAILVVQSSYYKNLYVDLAEHYSDIARSTGFEASIIREIEVRRVLAKINPRSSCYRDSTSYRESVLILERNS